MVDDKRGDDASDHAPRPDHTAADKGKPATPDSGRQEAPNYAERNDGGRGVPAENLNSANDE